ncbi:putative 60S ribosomal protein L44 [Seiridium cardinale]|uniref:60S ribosomal protein L44 n=1 Tax=Seiridium cardinale TaxID=138064 RepID=A0ABR2Y878_9PEZI
MASVLESTDLKNKLEDLSGVVLKPGENPYNALIETCGDDPAQIQALYNAHRVKRNAQQKEKFISPEFKELIIDPYLLRLENPSIEPGFKDQRNCMTFWGRPPLHVLALAEKLQQKLKACAPNIWLMPLHRMHITTLEITFSKTPEEIHAIKQILEPAIPRVANYTFRHRARLVKPLISYDLSAFAVSFLPASGEQSLSPPPAAPDAGEVEQGDQYTYHHLRRDAWSLVKEAGITVDSRYIVPSAHITLGRYLTDGDHATPEQRKKWVETIDEINQWLEAEIWDQEGGDLIGEWVIGQERGLDVRVGTLWYGGGRTVLTGEGF